MQLWLATRKDRVDWDEYDGFVVRATTRQKALKIVKAHEEETSANSNGSWKISSVRVEGKEEVVLDSFNAG